MYPCNYQPWHYPSHYPQGSMNRCYSWNPYDYSWNNHQWPFSRSNMVLKDYGGQPFVVDIEQAAEQNKTYRTALWTGEHLQVTLMSIPVGGDIGLEMHPTTDQFIRIEEGQGLVKMGDSKEKLDFEQHVDGNYAIMIPAGTWHNVINIGYRPLKLYSIYGPPSIRLEPFTQRRRVPWPQKAAIVEISRYGAEMMRLVVITLHQAISEVERFCIYDPVHKINVMGVTDTPSVLLI